MEQNKVSDIAIEAANKMEAAFHCGPRDVKRFAEIIQAAIEKAIAAQPDGMMSGGVQKMAAQPQPRKDTPRRERSESTTDQIRAVNRYGHYVPPEEREALEREMASGAASSEKIPMIEVEGMGKLPDMTNVILEAEGATSSEPPKATLRFHVEHDAVITPSGKLFHRCRTLDIAKRECRLLNDELAAEREKLKPLVDALELALYEMRHTTAPRNSFTDAVDNIDAALASVKQNTSPAFSTRP